MVAEGCEVRPSVIWRGAPNLALLDIKLPDMVGEILELAFGDCIASTTRRKAMVVLEMENPKFLTPADTESRKVWGKSATNRIPIL